jgi:hypothetical protein
VCGADGYCKDEQTNTTGQQSGNSTTLSHRNVPSKSHNQASNRTTSNISYGYNYTGTSKTRLGSQDKDKDDVGIMMILGGGAVVLVFFLVLIYLMNSKTRKANKTNALLKELAMMDGDGWGAGITIDGTATAENPVRTEGAQWDEAI